MMQERDIAAWTKVLAKDKGGCMRIPGRQNQQGADYIWAVERTVSAW